MVREERGLVGKAVVGIRCSRHVSLNRSFPEEATGGGMARRQNGGKRSEMHSGSGKREEKTATFAGIQ